MKPTRLLLLGAAALALALLPGCVTGNRRNPNPPAYRPHNPANVRVKVSLSTQQVYVLEGNRPLLLAATCVGVPQKPTPTGTFRVYNKIAHKRSGSYGFYHDGRRVYPAVAGKGRGRYIGHPMPYWVEFAPAYGFHEGYVWPVPRSHGCLRLHKNVAAKFYALVRVGTPVSIAHHQPEDAVFGRLPRPVDFRDPDPSPLVLINDATAFPPPAGPLFVD